MRVQDKIRALMVDTSTLRLHRDLPSAHACRAFNYAAQIILTILEDCQPQKIPKVVFRFIDEMRRAKETFEENI